MDDNSNNPVFMLHIETFIKECDSSVLNSVDRLNEILASICQDIGVSIVDKISHNFSPNGVSIVYILSASHLALHTWPEKGFAHLDLISCTKDLSIDSLNKSVANNFGTTDVKTNELS